MDTMRLGLPLRRGSTSLLSKLSVQVVPTRVIEDQNALGIEDVYVNISGVAPAGNTLNAQTEVRPMIRGFESGVPLRNGLRATTVGAVDSVNIESVEVLKGPASPLRRT
jgi:iron complex outermembrane recepter protein